MGDLYDTTDAAGLQEFPLQALAKIVSLIVTLNQFTYAFDPRVLGPSATSPGARPSL